MTLLCDVQTGTEEAAVDIAVFVAAFFERFDKFKGRGFHLSGESYGVSSDANVPQNSTYGG